MTKIGQNMINQTWVNSRIFKKTKSNLKNLIEPNRINKINVNSQLCLTPYLKLC